MRCIFQMMNCEDGTRSPVIVSTRDELAERLVSTPPPVECNVLTLMEEKNGEWEFCQAPVFSVPLFIEFFNIGSVSNG